MFPLSNSKHRFSLIVLFILLALVLVQVPQARAQQATYKQSPMLDDQVKSGNLPAITDRLPKDPAVVKPFNETGKFGGALRVGFVGNNPGWGGLWYITGWENLVIWKPDFSGIEPNIAESW